MNMRKLQKIVYAGLLGGALLLNGVSSAAVVTNRLPLLGYADHNIAVYRAPGGVQAAIVPAITALIQITQVRADGWAYGSYPLNGRRAGGWFRMSDIQNNVNYSNVAGTIVSQQPVYRTPNRSGSNGIVTAGDNVLVIAEQSELSQIIYKQNNSVNWRIGWVMTSAVKKSQTNVVTGSPVANKTIQTTQTANTTVTKTAQVAPSNNSQTTAQKTSTGSTAKTANPQTNNITLSNTSNAGLQLGKVSNQVINRYGKALQQVPAFTAANLLNRSGIINAGSTFVVLEASDNAYKITYSANNQLLERWVNKNYVSLLNVDYKIWQGKMIRRANAFYNVALTQYSNQKEYADNDDVVTVLNEQGNAYFISYPLNNGSYKARWVEKSAVSGTNPNRVITQNPVINNNTNPTVKPVQRQNVTNGIKGDMNQDGKVNQADLEIMSQIQVGKMQATDVHKTVGDMNGDGNIDIIDYSQLNLLVKEQKSTPSQSVQSVNEIAKRYVNVFEDAGLKTPLAQRYIEKGESYSVIGQSGNALHVKYKSGKGEDREGWVSSQIREKIFVPEELQKLIDIWVNQKWQDHHYTTRAKQCKEFAAFVFNELTGVDYIGSTNSNQYLINLSYPNRTDKRGVISGLTADNAKILFASAQPGDFIQMKRKKSGWGHSAILVNKDDSGVAFFEANANPSYYDKIEQNFYTWEKLATMNAAMSVYYAK